VLSRRFAAVIIRQFPANMMVALQEAGQTNKKSGQVTAPKR
jgi:hypothetical protein